MQTSQGARTRERTIKAPFSINSRNDRNFIDQSVRLLNHMLLVSRRVKIMGVSLTVSSLLCIGCFLASHFHACQVLWHEFSHTECVGILSCTCAWNANDVTTPTTPTTTPRMGWRFATESPWTLWHTRWVPARTPTVHRCPTRKAVGGEKQAPRDDSRQTTRQTSSQTCFHKQVQSDTCNHTECIGRGLCEREVRLTFLKLTRFLQKLRRFVTVSPIVFCRT